MNDIIIQRYKELACAIVEQEINDFLKGVNVYYGTTIEQAENIFYNFCTTNRWFDYLDLDGEYLYVKVLKMKEKGRKTVWLKNKLQKTNSESK